MITCLFGLDILYQAELTLWAAAEIEHMLFRLKILFHQSPEIGVGTSVTETCYRIQELTSGYTLLGTYGPVSVS